MNTHRIQLNSYCPTSNSGPIYLGTAGSHGNEQLTVIRGKGWENLAIKVLFHPCGVAVLLPADGLLEVPWEATAVPLSAQEGRIVFQGVDQDRLVNSTDLHYTVSEHSITVGRVEQQYTPGIVESVLNQMSAAKAGIQAAADDASQAKEKAAASAEIARINARQAVLQAIDARQNASDAQTAQTQAAASAVAAADYAAAASKTLDQVEDTGAVAMNQVQDTARQAMQQLGDSTVVALERISAAAPALPEVSSISAWQSVTVKPDCSGYNLAELAPISATIRPTVTGNPAVCSDSIEWSFQGIKIYGKSIQNGTPNPENPVPIMSAGDGGKISVNITSRNLFSTEVLSEETTKNGVIIKLLPDGAVNISGTPTGSSETLFTIYTKDNLTLPPGKYFISGSKYSRVRILRKEGHYAYFVNTAFSLNDGDMLGTYIQANIDNYEPSTFYPLLNFESCKIPFEPCQGFQTFAIFTPNGFSGIQVDGEGNYTDVDGQHWICDVKDTTTRRYTQNCIKVVFDGSDDENWKLMKTIHPDKFRYYIVPEKNALVPVSDDTKGALICNRLTVVTSGEAGTYGAIQGASVSSEGGIYVYLDEIHSDDVNKFKTWLKTHPLEIIYALAIPIESDIPEEELASYCALTTYDGATVVSTAENVAGLQVRYTANGTKYLQSVTDRIAALEASRDCK